MPVVNHLFTTPAKAGALKLGKHTAKEVPQGLRVLIVAENACNSFGGEAALPLRYFTSLRERGVETWLLTHARVRSELAKQLPQELERIYFVEESRLHRLVWRMGHPLEARLRRMTTDFILRLLTQFEQRKIARLLTRKHRIDVVHQPTPVSPREPSLIGRLSVPVIIGPMNGETHYPPAFCSENGLITRALLSIAPTVASLLSRVFRGKLEASILLVANERSRAALPKKTKAEIHSLADNGVDTALWQWKLKPLDDSICRFVFVGRLVRSKGVDLWIEACSKVIDRGHAIAVLVIGDGPDRAFLEEQARSSDMLADCLGDRAKVFFAGWQSQSRVAELLANQDCLVLPTLMEAGGAVLLEAMAVGLPVIATKWGGPMDYVDSSCGILVSPNSRLDFVDGLAEAMERLVKDPDLRERMGQAGRTKVERSYDWDSKIDRILEFYARAAVQHTKAVSSPPHPLRREHQCSPST